MTGSMDRDKFRHREITSVRSNGTYAEGQAAALSMPSTPLHEHIAWLTSGAKGLAQRGLLAVLLAALLLLPASVALLGQVPPQTRAERATVFIMQDYDIDGKQALSCVGSGTLISRDGLILTNAHLGLSLGPCLAEKIIIALPVRVHEPPVPTYLAEVVQADTLHNLAILQITAGLDGSRIDTNSLNLPFVNISS